MLKKIENSAKSKLINKYGPKNKTSLKYNYIGMIMENLIFNKDTHQVTTFKDYMIWDYITEFFKRYYLIKESKPRLPKFPSFYKNYLKFFCIPTLIDTYSNEMTHKCSEKKAELFYNENYKRKKKDESELKDCGIYEDSESNTSEDKNKNSYVNMSKKFFDESAIKKIEKISPINTSIVLNESETKLKDDESGLLITVSEIDFWNENSLRNIIKDMKKNKNTKNRNKEIKNNLINKTNYDEINNIKNIDKNKHSRNKSLDIFLNLTNNKKEKMNTIDNVKLYLKQYNKKPEIGNTLDFNKNSNYIININNNNNLNQIINDKSNNPKIVTSIYNYNHSRNKVPNHNTLSIMNSNSNRYINNNLDKITNIKRNVNMIKNKNIETILEKYKMNPTISLIKDKRQIFNKKNKKENSVENIFIKNYNEINNLKLSSNKYHIKNSSSSLVKLPKSNLKRNINQKTDTKINKKTARILSCKNININDNKNIKKNKNYNKLSFDGILNNNNNKRYNIINYNGNGNIHNVNININNNINIGAKQFQEIISLSDLVNKKNIHNKNINYISRNKQNSLGLNSIFNYTNKYKVNSVTDIHNTLNKNSAFKTQYMVIKENPKSIYDFKNKRPNKIKLNNKNYNKFKK